MTPESPETREDPHKPASAAPPDARQRAAAYLDLWEAHLAILAAEGAPPAQRPGRRPS